MPTRKRRTRTRRNTYKRQQPASGGQPKDPRPHRGIRNQQPYRANDVRKFIHSKEMFGVMLFTVSVIAVFAAISSRVSS